MPVDKFTNLGDHKRSYRVQKNMYQSQQISLMLFEISFHRQRKCYPTPIICVLTDDVISLQVTASCPAVCECPKVPLVCPPGVSTVPDGCGCCKVCAAQLNQDCSSMRPCDHHKGLECNYGNDVTMAWGICRGERGGNNVCWDGRNFT